MSDSAAGRLRSGWVLIALAAMFAGCAQKPTEVDHSSRYTLSQDRAPDVQFDASEVPDAVPRFEPRRAAGNRSPYTVWGKQYRVMDNVDGYVETGIASWYGEKFHGHKTSNGEVFNMYAMSAAHKSLPIPMYARVTNLANGKSVIVRVNDRGPFHDDRLIDLSYAAALRLDFMRQGTARVRVEAITVRPDGSTFIAGERVNLGGQSQQQIAANGQGLFVQLGAFSQREAAQRFLEQVRVHSVEPVRLTEVEAPAGRFHRVQVGPFQDEQAAQRQRDTLVQRGFERPIVIADAL